MNVASRLILREQAIVERMIRMYCARMHESRARMCPSCAELRDYATGRLSRCRYAHAKPPCSKCPTHCYAPERRDAIRAIMRFAGPRMIVRHPFSALYHVWRVARYRNKPSLAS